MKPKLAAHSRTGKPVPINRLRGVILSLDEERKLVIPSALRIRDSGDRKREFTGLVDDLRSCAKILRTS